MFALATQMFTTCSCPSSFWRWLFEHTAPTSVRTLSNGTGPTAGALPLLRPAHLCFFLPQAFDELLLLQRGGSTLYCGALGKDSQDLVSYFEQLGAPSITPGYNPATWMLENTTASVEEKNDVSFAEEFQRSELKG